MATSTSSLGTLSKAIHHQHTVLPPSHAPLALELSVLMKRCSAGRTALSDTLRPSPNVISFNIEHWEGNPSGPYCIDPASYWFLAPRLSSQLHLLHVYSQRTTKSLCAASPYQLPSATPPSSHHHPPPSLLSALWIRDALVWDADKMCTECDF